MVNVGILGAGFAGSHHARGYRHHPDVRLRLVVDLNLERAAALAKESGAQAASDPARLIDDPHIQLVDICLPTPFHRQYAVQALEAGKHVVVEKPLALTLEDADAILAAAKSSGKFLMVAHVLRFWPEYLALRVKLLSSELGKPLAASAQRLSNMPQWAEWFRDPAQTGGAVLDLMIHDLDMCNWLFGRPRRVRASGIQDASGGWNHVSALVSYEGVQAAAEASQMMPRDFPFTAGLRVLCQGGVAEYQFRAGGASFESGQPVSYAQFHTPGRPFQPLAVEPGDAFENELSSFVACVRDEAPPVIVTPADARLALQTSLAVREALETGREVDILNASRI